MGTNQASGNFYKLGFFVLAAIILFIGGIFSANAFKKQPVPADILPSPTIFFEETFQASPTVAIPSSIPTITETGVSDEEGIKQAFAKKYSRDISEVIVTISKNTGQYAQGSVRFAGEMGGGWFLAYKKDTGWIIVADGNGIIPCDTVAPYNFPHEMTPDC